MTTPIHLGISTCPNDTFAFHAIMERKIELRGLDFHIELQDVEQLNRRLFTGEFDVCKASFHAALLLADELGVLSSGSALGYGVGPLLLGAKSNALPGDNVLSAEGATRPAIVLCPGQHTTATLLYRLFHPSEGEVRHVVFSEIMPALESGAADFGVCIHEGRFTWKQRGLALVEDLGTRWEEATGTPLPLGGILARHRLGASLLRQVQQVVRDSIEYAQAHRDETVSTMRRYAQELSDDVIFAHVDLYVNEWTRELGETGRTALHKLYERAQQADILPSGLRRLEVIGG